MIRARCATPLRAMSLAFGLILAAAPALAAATGGDTAAVPSPLAQARAEIDAGRYPQAMRLLATIVRDDPRNADALNLMGYANRKMKRLAEAARWYDAALKVDPRHVGALEYQGELFVELGQMDRARQNLLVLKSVCGTCAEYRDLAEAIASAGSG